MNARGLIHIWLCSLQAEPRFQSNLWSGEHGGTHSKAPGGPLSMPADTVPTYEMYSTVMIRMGGSVALLLPSLYSHSRRASYGESSTQSSSSHSSRPDRHRSTRRVEFEGPWSPDSSVTSTDGTDAVYGVKRKRHTHNHSSSTDSGRGLYDEKRHPKRYGFSRPRRRSYSSPSVSIAGPCMYHLLLELTSRLSQS